MVYAHKINLTEIQRDDFKIEQIMIFCNVSLYKTETKRKKYFKIRNYNILIFISLYKQNNYIVFIFFMSYIYFF